MKFLKSTTINTNHQHHQPTTLIGGCFCLKTFRQLTTLSCSTYLHYSLMLFLLIMLVPNNAQTLHQMASSSSSLQPIFTKSMDSHNVKENTPIGEVIYTLEAHLLPSDRQPISLPVKILYGIEGTQLFSVNKTSGQVRVAQLIDREQTNDSITFQVSATPYYANRPGPPAQLMITVYILDENDNPPRIERIRIGRQEFDSLALARYASFSSPTSVFSLSSTNGLVSPLKTPIIRLNVSESTPTESVIIDLIEAVDVDKASSNPLSAICLDCEPEFELRPITTNLLNDRLDWSIVLVKTLVHVPRNNIRPLHVIVNDGKYNTSIVFEITIEDVQNKPPQFIGSTTCIVNENVPIDKIIMTIQAIDGDAVGPDDSPGMLPPKSSGRASDTSGRQIIYDFITPGGQATSLQDDFKLHPLTGELQVANRLDREAYLSLNGVLSLQVRARELTVDGETIVSGDDLYDSILNKLSNFVDQSPDAMTLIEITVILVDVNDNEPHWLNESEIATLNMNQSPIWHNSLPNDRDTGRNYQIQVYENSLPGSPITARSEMFVYDLDNGENAEFNITLVDPFNLFDVEPKRVSGFALITLKLAQNPTRKPIKVLDYENLNERSYIIQLYATETKTSERFSSKAQVQVNVLDVNDNAPEFKENAYIANLREDAPAGKTVKLVQATDKDETSKQLSYSLHGRSAYLFDINPTSGLVTVAKCEANQQQQRSIRLGAQGGGSSQQRPCIDYELQRSHHLMVEASDGELSSRVPLTVFIDDASDNAPVFTLPIMDVVIEEGSERLDPPVKIEATDVDQTSVLTYSIVEGNFEGLFAINNVTGELQLTRPIRIAHDDLSSSGQPQNHMIDYRQQQLNKMTLVVQASDGVHSTNGTIRIDVLDANDNAPKFLKSHYEKEINESYGPDQHVITVRAFDLDRGNNARVSYKLERGSHGQFKINETSGEIIVSPNARPFDASKRDNYSLEVVAYDHGLISKSSYVLVHIKVLETNRKAPEFVPQIQRATIHESTLNNTIIHRMFVAEPQQLSQHQQADQVQAILVFEPGPIEGLDKHGQPVTDNERLESMFSVSTNTGDVAVNSGLDHDFAAYVNLTIFVTSRQLIDPDGNANFSSPDNLVEERTSRSTGYLVINIMDDNSNAPIFAAPWTPTQPELSFQMLEELPVGSILTQLVASDADSKISHFKIEPPNEYFELTSPQSGVIINKKVIDYDVLMRQTFLTPGSHRSTQLQQQQPAGSNNIIQFNVFVYDSGLPQLSAKAIVSVEILPLNDWDCKFEQQIYEVHVKENTQADTVIIQVRASDLDFGEQHNLISYSLIGEQRDWFNIDSRTGVVTVSQKGSNDLDREQLSQSTIVLTVIGRDEQLQHVATDVPIRSRQSHHLHQQQQSHSTGRSCSATIRVHVDDVNDNPPLFSQKLYEITAYDTDTVDVPLIKLIVRDEDNFVNQQTNSSTMKPVAAQSINSFRILSGNVNDSFNITSGGVIYATKPLNESLATLNGQPIQLRVQVKQQSSAGIAAPGVPTLFTDECLVRINLLKINRYAPEWHLESLKSATIEENKRPNTLVTQLKCSDRDYDSRNYFGRIQTYEYEQADSANKAKHQSQSASVQQQASPIRYWIKENGSNVLETNEFKLDPISGNLVTRVELDRETQELYQLIVSCEDNGKPQSLESIMPLYIGVLDVDDNKPEFLIPTSQQQQQLSDSKNGQKIANIAKSADKLVNNKNRPIINFSVEEHRSKGLPVGELKAVDRDFESQFPINYCLIEGNEFQEFSLDSVTGILYTNQTLDREKQSTYDLLIKAINDGSTCEDHIQMNGNSSIKAIQPTVSRIIKRSSGMATSAQSQDSTISVRVDVLDINDNAPIFKRQTYRAGVHHRSLMNTLVTQVAAFDPDSGLNGTLNYKISEITLYKTNTGQQQHQSTSRKYDISINEQPTLSKPIKLIQFPFKIDQQGNLYTQQLLTQYQLMSMFVLHIEATEQTEPWRTATTKLEIYVYETNSQLKIRINLHPRFIETYRYEIETLLSNATKYTAVINRARSYHGNIDTMMASTSNRLSSSSSSVAQSNNQRGMPTLNLLPPTNNNNNVHNPVPSFTKMSNSDNEPSFSNIHLIFVDNYRIVNPNLVMEKFDLTSAQLFTSQLLTQQLTGANNNNVNEQTSESQFRNNNNYGSDQSNDVSSLIDKIALASVQPAEYHSNPSGLAGIDWLESPSVLYVSLTALLVLIGFMICLVGCCCTSRVKDHIIKVAMDKLVKQQTLQAKINERVLAATNQAYASSNASGQPQDYMLQQGALMSSFDATKGCINNNFENMSILQRAMEAGEFIDPNYTTINGHINMGAHYYDASELEEQNQINVGDNGQLEVGTSKQQLNGSTISLSLVDDVDEADDPAGEDLNNSQQLVKKSKLFSNGVNGVVSSSRQRQQIPNNNNSNHHHQHHEL